MAELEFHNSKYYTAEEMDERLFKGTYDDAVKAGFKGSKEEFDSQIARTVSSGESTGNEEIDDAYTKVISDAIRKLPQTLTEAEKIQARTNIDAVGKTDIVNDLTTGGANKALSAEMGKELNREIDDFKNIITDQVESYKPIEIQGDVVNAPDEEDITSDGDNLLKLKNRSQLYGMGYVILRRDKSFAEQIIGLGTIYEIRYNFDLDGKRVAIPADCVLKYVGGSLSNGTIVYNNTIVEGIERLNNVVTEGEFKYPYTTSDKEEGESINEQLAPTLAQVRKLSTEITNIADDEDLTKIYDSEKGQEVLQLKDRKYVQGSNSGMGYVVLRQNKSFKEQVTEANTIYEIRYDFDLGGEEVEIPENCVLKFEGGNIDGSSKASLVGNQTRIEASITQIFKNTTLKGTFVNNDAYPEWWGCRGKPEHDDSDALQMCMKSPIRRIVFSQTYYISKPVEFTSKYITGFSAYAAYATYGIEAMSSFQPIEITLNDVAYIINSMLYTTRHAALSIKGIVFNGRYVCGSAYKSIGYALIDFKDCSFTRFYECAIWAPNGDSSVIDGCYMQYNYIALMISGLETNLNKPLTRGSETGSPNHYVISNCNITLNTFGVIVKNSTNIKLDSNLFGYNSMQPLYIYNVKDGVLINNYFEGDFSGKHYITKGYSSDPTFANKDNTILPELLGLDEITYLYTSNTPRAYVTIDNSCIAIDSIFISNWYLRCYKGNDNYPTKEVAGIDSIIFACHQSKVTVNPYKVYDFCKIDNNSVAFLYDITISSVNASNLEVYSKTPLRVKHTGSYYEDAIPVSTLKVVKAHDALVQEGFVSDAGTVSTRPFVVYNRLVKMIDKVNFYELKSTSETYLINNAYLLNLNEVGNSTLDCRLSVYSETDKTVALGFMIVYVQNGERKVKTMSNSVTLVSNVVREIVQYLNVEELGEGVSSVCISMYSNDTTKTLRYSHINVQPVGAGDITSYQYPVSGVTARRPVLTDVFAGYRYWDTTLNKPIWWDGTKWVDAIGAEV